jgi:hypothetical protein
MKRTLFPAVALVTGALGFASVACSPSIEGLRTKASFDLNCYLGGVTASVPDSTGEHTVAACGWKTRYRHERGEWVRTKPIDPDPQSPPHFRSQLGTN